MIRTIFAARSRGRTLVAICSLSLILFAASTTRAATITYTILPQPEPDMTNAGYTVDVSGTLTFSGLTGTSVTLNSSNDSGVTVSSDLTMTTTDGPLSVTQSGSVALDNNTLTGGNLYLTPTGLSVDDSTAFRLQDSATESDPLVQVLWNLANGGEYQGTGDAVAYNGPSMSFLTYGAGSYVSAGGGQWEIAAAAVPEPATLTLLASAMLALGVVVGLRRRRGLAC